MRSMTGYGRSTVQRDGRAMTVELKSVNHRFLDLNIRLPRGLTFLEDDARRIIGERLLRGHVDVFLNYRNDRSDARTAWLDEGLLNAYSKALDQLAQAGFRDDRTVLGMARLPDLIVISEAEEDQAALKALLREALGGALDELVAMREREGAAMGRDLSEKLDVIERLTGDIERRYPDTVVRYQARLRAAIEELVGQGVDEARLLTEVAVMADRSAIAEETVRLHSHIAQLRQALAGGDSVGRRLDFIVQELNREVNTISSKSQDIPITNSVMDCKSEIEKLREQLQNIE